jgi:hypothetical protein
MLHYTKDQKVELFSEIFTMPEHFPNDNHRLTLRKPFAYLSLQIHD